MQGLLITGSNRGIGLEMVRQLTERDDVLLFATCRQPENADQLNAIAAQHPTRVKVLPLDVSDASSIRACVERVKQHTGALDVLINNAGIFPNETRSRTFGQLEADAINHILSVNATAPLIVTQAFTSLLEEGNNPRVVMVSSQMGSLAWTGSGGSYAYRASKAAMNMVARTLSHDLKPMGISVITLHPGWVQTDMGGRNAAITPQESAAGILRLVDDITLADSGGFFRWTGDVHPW